MPSTSLELKDIIVRAGAGAGKTTDLVRRVLELEEKIWKEKNRHAKIVVTTFTRKATQELKERLLAKALASENPETINFVQRPSQLHISTIHGVLSAYLSGYGSALGLSPQFQVLSQKAVLNRAKKILRNSLQEDSEFAARAARLLEVCELSGLLESLLQYEVVWSLGSAKRVTATDLQSLISEKLEWVRQKATELLSLFGSDELSDSWRNYETALQALVSQKELSVTDVLSFLEKVKSPVKSKKISEELGQEKNNFQDLLKEFSGYYLRPEFLEAHESLSTDFEYIGKIFSEKLSQQKILTGQLSLSDLELLSLKLMRDFPQTGVLFSEEWDYWMVDEYQDTSPLQVHLLKGLMGLKKSFTVGDPQQSIYLFRGARSEVFLEKEKIVRTSLGENLSLMVNYRSQAPLLAFFNELFTRLNSAMFKPMEVGFRKNLSARENEPVQILLATDVDQEIAATLTRVRELIELGISPEKICVLSRGNKELDILAKEAKQVQIPVQVHASSQFSDRQEIRDAVALLRFLVNPSDNLSFLQCLRGPFHFVSDEKLQDLVDESWSSYFVRALSKNWQPVFDMQKLLEKCRSQGIISVWKEALRDHCYFDYLQALDSSGRKEANLWKLVSLLSTAEKMPGFSILDFLDEMTSPLVESDGDQDATPVVEPSKVNLMTIHASKGLQFEYVIVPFLGKRSANSTVQFFLSDDEGAWTLALPNPEDGKMTKSLYGEVILENKKSREALELERLFYVALTRAEMGISLIWSGSDKGTISSRLLAMGYGVAAPDENLDQVDRPERYSLRTRFQNWAVKVEQTPSNQDQSKVRSRYDSVTLSHLAKERPVAVTEVLSDSLSFDSSKKTSEESLQSLQKALLGVEVHRLFEGLKFQSQLDSKDPKIKKAIEFLKSWSDGRILELIKMGEAEWGFAVAKNRWLLQGQIDLWSQDSKGRYFVVDYKTGAEKYKEKAFEQLEIYAWALRKMGKIPTEINPILMVIYPFSAAVFEKTAAEFKLIDSILDSKSQQNG